MVCLLKCFGVKLDWTAAFEIAMLRQSLPNSSFIIHFLCCLSNMAHEWQSREMRRKQTLRHHQSSGEIMTAPELRKILSQDSVRARAETPLVLSENYKKETKNSQSLRTPVIIHVCVAMPLKFPPEAFLPTNSALPWKTICHEQPPATSACPAAQPFILLEPRAPQQVPEGSEKQKLSIQ